MRKTQVRNNMWKGNGKMDGKKETTKGGYHAGNLGPMADSILHLLIRINGE